MMKYNSVILFTSYYFATKAERELKALGEQVCIAATPEALHHACGLCLLSYRKDMARLIEEMKALQISWTGLYEFEEFKGPYHRIEEDEV